ncbi:hypothetical protein KI688_012983 [Linnemannia hyalina]|uniref:Myb-like domain-containing protein n=1 Tax=Linnemannia hyalina TaxID=64524 RepID=A0A9P7XTM0_9FUNG|nr:hypothetical protein KI688_012983 [Linnemannia hyalina]
MDPHSIKRPRIMPPEAKSLQIPANFSLPQQHAPTRKSNPAPLHQVPDMSFAPRSGINTSTLGLNASSTVLPNFMSGSSNRSLLNVPEHQGGPTRRNSYSNRHAKDTLFHKDTHHYPGISKQQQIQLERQKKFNQQAQLQQAHQEFHRQRELYQMQQQQQLQQRLPTAPATSASSQPQGSSLSSRTPHAQHHHHHHHHHHFHVHPHMTNSSNIQQQLNLTISSSVHSQRAIASIPISSSTSSSSYPGAPSSDASHPSSSNTSAASPGSASGSPRMSSSNLHHHHHHHTSLHQHLPPQRPNQFSEWTNVKEKERARLLSNMARVRETQPPMPSAEAARENLKRLSHRLHQRRTRARETILYDLHQGVKTVEAQVHKQVDMVLSRLKDAPGSKYAFALTHTFLTQIPQALSNTILPSAISAVADTVAGRTTNSLTTLRGRAGLDEFDEDDEDEDDEDDLDDLDDIEELSYQQQLALLRSHQQQDSGVSQQLSSEFGTIALASSSSSCSGSCSSGSSSATEASAASGIHHSGDESVTECYGEGTKSSAPVSISRKGASEFLSASTHHNYSISASQVLNAALPSFIPSMVAPIVCVFSYPSPPTTKPSTPQQSTPLSPSLFNLAKDNHKAASGTGSDSLHEIGTLPLEPERTAIKQEPVDEDMRPHHRIKVDPGIVVVNSNAWTSAEREALFLAATRFRLHGQWSKIRQMMGLHRTDKEIEDEYQRLYGEDDEGMQSDDDADEDLVPIKQESDVEDDGDADDEAEPAVFMRFGGQRHATTPRQHSHTLAAQQRQDHQFTITSGGSVVLGIQPLPTVPTPANATASSTRPSHRHTHGHHARSDRGGHGHGHHRHHDRLSKSLNEKPLRIIKKEVMIDKRFTLEDIPMRI